MAIEKISVKYVGETLYSPFTGAAVDGPDGPNETDPSVLFVYYGDAGEYAFISEAARNNLAGKGIAAANELTPTELLDKLDIESAFAIEVDAGWNGINYYGFFSNEVG